MNGGSQVAEKFHPQLHHRLSPHKIPETSLKIRALEKLATFRLFLRLSVRTRVFHPYSITPMSIIEAVPYIINTLSTPIC